MGRGGSDVDGLHHESCEQKCVWFVYSLMRGMLVAVSSIRGGAMLMACLAACSVCGLCTCM